MLFVHLAGTGFVHIQVAHRVLVATRIWIERFFKEGVCTMTSQNVTGNGNKTQDKPLEDSALKAAKPSDVRRELTDDEIAAVAGGKSVGLGGKMNPP